MTTLATPMTPAVPSYLRTKPGILAWLTTTDHKKIGLMYLAGMMVFFLFAGHPVDQ